MITRVIAFALQRRFITLALALLLLVGGIVSWHRLPIEAYPEVADIQVDVLTVWPGHAAEEVERLITIALEKELNGIAGVTFLRSISNFGISNIRAVFADGTDSYWARQQVLERITQAELPPDVKPTLGPLAGAVGELYRYTLESKTMPLVELKALQDWMLEREFRKVPGVADVISWGGGIKQYQITVDPGRLRAYNLTHKQVFDAVSSNNANAGGSYIRQGEYALMVRGIGLLRTTEDLRDVRSGSATPSASASSGVTTRTTSCRASSSCAGAKIPTLSSRASKRKSTNSSGRSRPVSNCVTTTIARCSWTRRSTPC